MLGTKTIEIIDACVLTHPSTTDLAEMASSRTIGKTLQKLEELGIIERYVTIEGVGRPKRRCRLTRMGLKLKRILDNIRFHAEFERLKQFDIPATVGVFRSMAEGYGAPLVAGYELAVPNRFVKKARRLLTWAEIKIDEIPWMDFYKRGVSANDLRYLGLEDLIVLAAVNKENPARLQACATTIIRDFAGRIDYSLLLEIALKAKVVNEVGGLLYLTNRLTGKAVVPQGTLNKFKEHVTERDIDRHARYHVLVAQGVSPSEAEHPVDVDLREKWCARLPTFEECREVFGWRGKGKFG